MKITKFILAIVGITLILVLKFQVDVTGNIAPNDSFYRFLLAVSIILIVLGVIVYFIEQKKLKEQRTALLKSTFSSKADSDGDNKLRK